MQMTFACRKTYISQEHRVKGAEIVLRPIDRCPLVPNIGETTIWTVIFDKRHYILAVQAVSVATISYYKVCRVFSMYH